MATKVDVHWIEDELELGDLCQRKISWPDSLHGISASRRKLQALHRLATLSTVTGFFTTDYIINSNCTVLSGVLVALVWGGYSKNISARLNEDTLHVWASWPWKSCRLTLILCIFNWHIACALGLNISIDGLCLQLINVLNMMINGFSVKLLTTLFLKMFLNFVNSAPWMLLWVIS